MELGLSYRSAMSAALDAARMGERIAAAASRRAEASFATALAGDGADAQAAAERFRAAHRAHVEARTELAELEAVLAEDDALAA